MSIVLPHQALRRSASWKRRGYRPLLLATTLFSATLGSWAIYKNFIAPEPPSLSPVAALSTTAVPNEAAAAAIKTDDAPAASHADVVGLCSSLLKQAEQTLSRIDTIQAVFHKQERISGKLQELNVMQLKVRREPMSVYMRWQQPDEGREVIWQVDANDGQILAHPGGWRRKLVPLVKLDPLSERAMESSRRPISSAGLWKFNQRLREFVDDETTRGPHVRAEVSEAAQLGGRPCYCFQFVLLKRLPDLEFHKVVIFVDKELKLPIALEHYGWPTNEAPQTPLLEESYVFNDLKLNPPLADIDFSAENPTYQYGR
jgi:hypothetical protein